MKTTSSSSCRPLLQRLALLLSFAFFFGCSGASKVATAASADSASPKATKTSAAAFLGKFYPSQGHTHLMPSEPDDFVYNSNPPTSGPHREIFNSAFISPTPLPNYVQVHLLEHGNVLLQYNCTCPSLANSLAAIAMQYDSKLIPAKELQPLPIDVQNAEEQGLAVVVAPYPHMKSKIALTAWTRLATLKVVDKPKIVSFISTYLHNVVNASQ